MPLRDSLAEVARTDIVIATAEDYTRVAEQVLGWKALRRQIGDFFTPLRAAANALRSALLAREREAVEPVEALLEVAEARLVAWRRAQDLARQTEVARAQRDATERAREEQQQRAGALRAAAKVADDPEVKSILRQQATQLAKAPLIPEPVNVPSTVPKIAGLHITTTWRAEVVDLHQLLEAVVRGEVPLDAIAPNLPWLTGQARQLREAFRIPGCRAVPQETVVARGGGR